MNLAAFADHAEAIEAETADVDIIAEVTALLAAADEDLPIVARYAQGRVFPGWVDRKLDVGPSLCHAAIARAAGTNVTAADVEDRLAETGDIGAVAASYDFGGQQGLSAFTGGREPLTVAEVHEEFERLADASGPGSQDRKLETLFGLFNRCEPREARYLARLVLSEMRIGVGGGTVRDAIASAFDVPVEAVSTALQVTNDYGEVALIAREQGEVGLADCQLTVGRPVRAMLAQAGTVTDALAEWESVACEVKYDGARVQIHVDPDGFDADESTAADADRQVAIFSRNMEDVTDPLPEVVEYIEARVDEPVILDGEVLAVDDDGQPLPFQEVLRRFRRKHDVAQTREEVELRVHAFDCLHAAGVDLLDTPLVDRRERLESVLPDGTSTFELADDDEAIEAIAADALDTGHEGIMLKNPASTYTPGRRGKNWLKRKPEVETLDLVVTGAEWGEGRRAQLLGTFLLSARTPDGFETLGKVATGITDAELESLTDLLEPHIRGESGTEVDIEPSVVFEVGYEEIQSSPTYSAGYALRFPRFVGVREDKDPEDADSLERVERLSEKQ